MEDLLGRLGALGRVKVERARLVDEEAQSLGSAVGRCLNFDRVDLDCLVEGQGNDELLVAVRFEVAGAGCQRLLQRVVITLVQTFAARLGHERRQVQLFLPIRKTTIISEDLLLLKFLPPFQMESGFVYGEKYNSPMRVGRCMYFINFEEIFTRRKHC